MKLKFKKKIKSNFGKRIDIQKITKNQEMRRKIASEMAKALRPEDDNMNTVQVWRKWKTVQREIL